MADVSVFKSTWALWWFILHASFRFCKHWLALQICIDLQLKIVLLQFIREIAQPFKKKTKNKIIYWLAFICSKNKWIWHHRHGRENLQTLRDRLTQTLFLCFFFFLFMRLLLTARKIQKQKNSSPFPLKGRNNLMRKSKWDQNKIEFKMKIFI